MGISAESDEARGGTPRLATGCDPTRLSLSPEEGFLLSRIDGATPWSLLREISGLPADTVDRCLERWLAEGVVEIGGAASEAPPEEAPAPPAPPGAGADEAELDPSLDLDLEVQRRVLEFETRLGASYHAILGVEPSASPREIKRAYFRLSREFHPDRYFRREIGPFAARFQRIFRKLLEAHEMLSDPMARAEMEKSLAQETVQEPASPSPPAGRRVAPEEAQRRLRQISARAREVTARRQKAKHYFETGMCAFRSGRWLEAAASVRLAIAFDPANDAYRESFAEVQERAHEERAKQLVREGEAALEVREYTRAFHAFEEAVQFRPHDAELHSRAARIAWLSGDDLRKAKDLARLACELEPDRAAFRRTLGQIYHAAGLEANARRELKRALELDPGDEEARSAWAELGRG